MERTGGDPGLGTVKEWPTLLPQDASVKIGKVNAKNLGQSGPRAPASWLSKCRRLESATPHPRGHPTSHTCTGKLG